MSSLDTLEKSTEGSRPIELYRFLLGSTEYLFAASEDDITIGTDVYESLEISRGRLVQGSDQPRRTLTIEMPASEALPSAYKLGIPGVSLYCNVFRYQRDESPAFATQLLIFTGFVHSIGFSADGTIAKLSLLTDEATLRRAMPRIMYSAMCNNFLYDQICGADPNNHDHIGTVTAVSGNTITVSGASASGHDFAGGFAKPVGEVDYRQIYSQTGDVLELDLPFSVNPLGADVQAFAGCDHIIDSDCALVFDRVAQFVGDPWIPNRDLWRTGIQV